MSFDLDQVMAKVSGENTEDFAAKHIISDVDKAQVNFAFSEMFSGLSLLEWMKKVTLSDAWKIAMDKLVEQIFDIKGQGYIIDYLRYAVFDFRNRTLRNLASSIHAYEFIQYPQNKYTEMEQSAHKKIQTGMDIIKNILVAPVYRQDVKHNVKDVIKDNTLQHAKEKEQELERIRE